MTNVPEMRLEVGHLLPVGEGNPERVVKEAMSQLPSDSVSSYETSSGGLTIVLSANPLSRIPRRRLTAFLSSASALALGPLCANCALAATVTNCNNTGAGSLRSAIAATATGGTVTFSPSLSACTITLATSAIPITVADLTIQGPVSNAFTINAAQNYRVFNHSGTGTLSIEHLKIESGKYKASTSAKGGCIFSAGSVSLTGTTVTNCTAYATAATGKARGGALYAKAAVTLTNSTISGNDAIAFGGAYGGGVSGISFDAQYSTFDSNYATFPPGKSPSAGSLWEGGAARIGSGTTNITNSTFTNNKATGANNDDVYCAAKGGAIFAAGTAYLGASTVSGNFAGSHDNTQGGGIYATTTLTLSHSILSNNYGAGTNGSFGGALRASGLVANYTTIHGNRVSAGPYGFSGLFEGGGMFLYKGTTQISNSTIDGNVTAGMGGGVFTILSNITLNNTTVSGNTAYGSGSAPAGAGGIQMTGGAATLHINNSTIAFNTGSGGTNAYLGGGVRAYGTAVIESSIIANNTMGGTDPSDLSCNCGTNAGKKISGANDLILSIDPGAVAAPAGMIIVATDPELVPLGYHGGETQTHALPPNSPALGVGNNLGNFSKDQRGLGYPRLNGGSADIGAYERQPNDDEIFYGGLQ